MLKKIKHDNENGAKRDLLEELFNDIYKNRRRMYQVNFFRGIFFGLGSVLGGTVVVAIIVWVLSFFVHIPGAGNAIQSAQDKIEQTQSR